MKINIIYIESIITKNFYFPFFNKFQIPIHYNKNNFITNYKHSLITNLNLKIKTVYAF